MISLELLVDCHIDVFACGASKIDELIVGNSHDFVFDVSHIHCLFLGVAVKFQYDSGPPLGICLQSMSLELGSSLFS